MSSLACFVQPFPMPTAPPTTPIPLSRVCSTRHHLCPAPTQRTTLRRPRATAVMLGAEAIALSERGDFAAAARVLCLPASCSSSEKTDMIRRLLNPVTLDRLDSTDDSGVVSLYARMRSENLLASYGAYASRLQATATSSEKAVSIERLVSQANLPLSALSPKKSTLFLWQFAGISAVLSVVTASRALHLEPYAVPLLTTVFALFALDQTVLRGLVLEGAYARVFPGYRRRIEHHEAGHLLVGYLCGLPISGYVLGGDEALRNGIPGSAGTLFFDPEMSKQLQKGSLTNAIIDRYCCVVMAGIAAEACEYGQAEGGSGDESALVQLLSQLSPPWRTPQIKSQARWAVLQAILILRENWTAYEELTDAMRQRKPLGDCIEIIERLAVAKSGVSVEEGEMGAVGQDGTSTDADSVRSLTAREEQVLTELERIQQRLRSLDNDDRARL